jgi:2Fe-2S ferredoxin
MASVTYVQHDGGRHKIDVPIGDSVMQGAVDNMIEGIVAECGGGLACATCHCYVDEPWFEKLGAPSALENDMLDAVSAERRPNSRLSCQITVTEALDGITVHLPESQF